MNNMNMTFRERFRVLTGNEAFPWQERLATDPQPKDRLVRIPTGMGKTLGVLAAWSWNRLERKDAAWPRRLIWCLPMRTLVEQTAKMARDFLDKADHADVNVHVLMGGEDATDWANHPEKNAVLIGTQDMLLSRALNRGYAMGRAAWPVQFGLLNTDALWVLDEVQLMDVGLVSSAQLQTFARQYESGLGGMPRVSWWMSATLQPEWLRTRETQDWLPALKENISAVPEKERQGGAFASTKTVELRAMPDAAKDVAKLADEVLALHASHAPDPQYGRQTLLVLNTVDAACGLHDELQKKLKKEEDAPQLRLVHSRFRPCDRAGWAAEFLSRETLKPETNRIIVATQVVEAGVDISASCLVTDLAPWPSLVQRFGRAARYGGRAQVVVVDRMTEDAKSALPYAKEELESAKLALGKVDGVSLGELEMLEGKLKDEEPEFLARLYPYRPGHILVRRDLEDLFDTTPDLSGADVDVSRFIRSGDERDVAVFWRNLDGVKMSEFKGQPERAELCAVPVAKAREWTKKLKDRQTPAWVWDYLDGVWKKADAQRLYSGQVLLVDAAAGGYDIQRGFTGEAPKKGAKVPMVQSPKNAALQGEADLAERSEASSQANQWKTIATHAHEAAQVVGVLAQGLPAELPKILALALRLHDWGKAHPAFAVSYRVEPWRGDLAKAPKGAWKHWRQMYKSEALGHRQGFRHELASCLAAFELLRRAKPDHPALMGPHGGLVELGILPPVDEPADCASHPLAQELAALTAEEFDLLAWLLLSHHGKVRAGMSASPHDQDFPLDNTRFAGAGQPLRGVREGDEIPPIILPDPEGKDMAVPAMTLHLDLAAMGLSARYGASWGERVGGLLKQWGPYALAYFEALARAADVRASMLETGDARLGGIHLCTPKNPDPEAVDQEMGVMAEDDENAPDAEESGESDEN